MKKSSHICQYATHISQNSVWKLFYSIFCMNGAKTSLHQITVSAVSWNFRRAVNIWSIQTAVRWFFFQKGKCSSACTYIFSAERWQKNFRSFISKTRSEAMWDTQNLPSRTAEGFLLPLENWHKLSRKLKTETFSSSTFIWIICDSPFCLRSTRIKIHKVIDRMIIVRKFFQSMHMYFFHDWSSWNTFHGTSLVLHTEMDYSNLSDFKKLYSFRITVNYKRLYDKLSLHILRLGLKRPFLLSRKQSIEMNRSQVFGENSIEYVSCKTWCSIDYNRESFDSREGHDTTSFFM